MSDLDINALSIKYSKPLGSLDGEPSFTAMTFPRRVLSKFKDELLSVLMLSQLLRNTQDVSRSSCVLHDHQPCPSVLKSEPMGSTGLGEGMV